MQDLTTDESQLFDQVRRFKVHDDAHSGYVPAVIGHWDRRGYTHCLDHSPEQDMVLDVISCDNGAAEGDRCDICGVSILAAAVSRKNQRQPFPSTCPAAGNLLLPLT